MMPDNDLDMRNQGPSGPYPKVQVGDQLPTFSLPSTANEQIGPATFKKRRNLVVVLFQDSSCEPCRKFLSEMIQRRDDYLDVDAEIIAVDLDSLDKARGLAMELNLPFPLLADPSGEAARQFIIPGSRGEVPKFSAFVADRFGEIYAEYLSSDAARLPSQDDILGWLHLIDIQCPECGVPEWPLEQPTV
jgi:peroxiredoxin